MRHDFELAWDPPTRHWQIVSPSGHVLYESTDQWETWAVLRTLRGLPVAPPRVHRVLPFSKIDGHATICWQ